MSDEVSALDWTALVVDDSAQARRLILEKLRLLPLRIYQSTDVFDALVRFAEVEPDIVITDLRMPGGDGIALLRRLREFTNVPVVVLTSYPSVAACEKAILSGAQRFLDWRTGIDELPEVALELLERRDHELPGSPAGVAPARARRDEDLRSQLDRLLRECQGNISMIAERLQKDRATVTYHLKRLGLYAPKQSAGRGASLTPPGND